eukprot:585034-Prymnesium_polylepis.2
MPFAAGCAYVPCRAAERGEARVEGPCRLVDGNPASEHSHTYARELKACTVQRPGWRPMRVWETAARCGGPRGGHGYETRRRPATGGPRAGAPETDTDTYSIRGRPRSRGA